MTEQTIYACKGSSSRKTLKSDRKEKNFLCLAGTWRAQPRGRPLAANFSIPRHSRNISPGPRGLKKLSQCCGSGMFIPDPNLFRPGSRIRIFSIPVPGFRGQKGNRSRIRIRNTV